MKKYLLFTISLILLLFWPTQAQEINSPEEERPITPERLSTVSEMNYLAQLEHRGVNLDLQGLLIESLDGSTVFANHHSEIPFNPASVIKIATSFAALNRFGPAYRFETAFYADGDLNKKTRTLKGDLILHATGDPILTTNELNTLIRQVIRSGIARVNGDLIITGPFTFGPYYPAATATKPLQTALR